MTSPEELEQYLDQRYGGASALIVRDPDSSAGFREWNNEDTRSLCRWIDGPNGVPRPPAVICHNLEQTAAVMGVGTHTVQGWLRRKHDPLPHMRDGRRILVPHFMLIRWVKEEVERNLRGTNRRDRLRPEKQKGRSVRAAAPAGSRPGGGPGGMPRDQRKSPFRREQQQNGPGHGDSLQGNPGFHPSTKPTGDVQPAET